MKGIQKYMFALLVIISLATLSISSQIRIEGSISKN